MVVGCPFFSLLFKNSPVILWKTWMVSGKAGGWKNWRSRDIIGSVTKGVPQYRTYLLENVKNFKWTWFKKEKKYIIGLHSCVVVSSLPSQREGPGTFLCWVYILSMSYRVSPDTLAFPHSPMLFYWSIDDAILSLRSVVPSPRAADQDRSLVQ